MAAQATWPAATTVEAHTQGSLRIGQFNVLQPNGKKEAVLATVRASGAEVLSFQEVDHAWAAVLDTALSRDLPYRVIVPRTDCYGIALFSKFPLEGAEVMDVHGAPVVHAVVRKNGFAIAVTSVHARSPLPYSAFVERNRQFRSLAYRLSRVRLPQVVVGDMNAVAWDEALVQFSIDAGGLRIHDNEPATFPNIIGVPLIPIDHVLVSPELEVVAQRTMELSGSDHYALIADIAPRLP
jgi:endonuclease/exonuclease/phosphatase (EEP) superfamily protein YafD